MKCTSRKRDIDFSPPARLVRDDREAAVSSLRDELPYNPRGEEEIKEKTYPYFVK